MQNLNKENKKKTLGFKFSMKAVVRELINLVLP